MPKKYSNIKQMTNAILRGNNVRKTLSEAKISSVDFRKEPDVSDDVMDKFSDLCEAFESTVEASVPKKEYPIGDIGEVFRFSFDAMDGYPYNTVDNELLCNHSICFGPNYYDGESPWIICEMSMDIDTLKPDYITYMRWGYDEVSAKWRKEIHCSSLQQLTAKIKEMLPDLMKESVRYTWEYDSDFKSEYASFKDLCPSVFNETKRRRGINRAMNESTNENIIDMVGETRGDIYSFSSIDDDNDYLGTYFIDITDVFKKYISKIKNKRYWESLWFGAEVNLKTGKGKIEAGYTFDKGDDEWSGTITGEFTIDPLCINDADAWEKAFASSYRNWKRTEEF